MYYIIIVFLNFKACHFHFSQVMEGNKSDEIIWSKIFHDTVWVQDVTQNVYFEIIKNGFIFRMIKYKLK